MINLDLLKRLCNAKAISGQEGEVRGIIIDSIKDYVDDYKIDPMGNIIAFKKGKESPKVKLMLSAHMDEVGFIVNHVTDEGYLKFAEVGGIDKVIVPGKQVTIGDNEVQGVIGINPIHLLKQDEKDKAVPISDLYIDIGANNKEQALEFVNLGDVVCFDSLFEEHDGIIKAKALDDRVGCYVLIDIIKSNLPYDMYFTFVVQEEVGLRGAKTAAYAIEPYASIVVEATTAADIPNSNDEKKVCKVLGGAVISFMDKRTIYDKSYYNLAHECAKDMGTKSQTKTMIAGGNDAGAIQASKCGVRTISISLPCRYLHSSISLASCYDLESVLLTVKETAKRIAGGYVK